MNEPKAGKEEPGLSPKDQFVEKMTILLCGVTCFGFAIKILFL